MSFSSAHAKKFSWGSSTASHMTVLRPRVERKGKLISEGWPERYRFSSTMPKFMGHTSFRCIVSFVGGHPRGLRTRRRWLPRLGTFQLPKSTGKNTESFDTTRKLRKYLHDHRAVLIMSEKLSIFSLGPKRGFSHNKLLQKASYALQSSTAHKITVTLLFQARAGKKSRTRRG